MKFLITTMLLAPTTLAAARPPRTRSVAFTDSHGAGYDLYTYKKRDAMPDPTPAPEPLPNPEPVRIPYIPISANAFVPVPESSTGSTDPTSSASSTSPTSASRTRTRTGTGTRTRTRKRPTSLPTSLATNYVPVPTKRAADAEPDANAAPTILAPGLAQRQRDVVNTEERREAEAGNAGSPPLFYVPVPPVLNERDAEPEPAPDADASASALLSYAPVPEGDLGTDSTSSGTNAKDRRDATPEPNVSPDAEAKVDADAQLSDSPNLGGSSDGTPPLLPQPKPSVSHAKRKAAAEAVVEADASVQ